MEPVVHQKTNGFGGFRGVRKDLTQETLIKGSQEWASRRDLGMAFRGHFGARLSYLDGSRLVLKPYSSQFIEIDGDVVDIGPGGVTANQGVPLEMTDSLIDAEGGETGSAPSASTLYYAYVGNTRCGLGNTATSTTLLMRPQGPRVRLSATAPTSIFSWPWNVSGGYYPGGPSLLGIRYLGRTDRAKCWRFIGWVYVVAGPAFADFETNRLVVNYYNRVRSRLYTCPAYSNNNAQSTWTSTATTWAQANGGSGNAVTFISNGEDAAELRVAMVASVNTSLQVVNMGISVDSTTDCLVAGSEQSFAAGANVSANASYIEKLSEGFHTGRMMIRTTGGTVTAIADDGRNGAVADVPYTYLTGTVMT